MDTSTPPLSHSPPRPLWHRWAVRLRRFHEWLVRPPVGLDPRFTDFYPLSNYVHGMGLLAHVLFLLEFAALGLRELAALNVLSIGVFVLTSRLSRQGRLDPALLIGGLEVAAHQGLAVWALGLDAGFQNFVLVLVMGTLFYSHIRLEVRVLMAVLPVGWYLLLQTWGLHTPPVLPLGAGVLSALSMVNAVLFIGILMGMAIYFQFAVARARDKAQRLAASKTLFLANMSHELRTPLNAILGFAQMLARSPDVPAEQRGKLVNINRSGEHLLTLINRILDMSKLEEGKLELRFSTFELGRLLDDVLGMFSAAAQAKGLKLVLRLGPGLPEVLEGDALRLRQVLINLVGNSLKFTHRGRIEVDVALAPHQPPHAWRLRFNVRDTGIGISRAEQADLFEVFTQTESGRNSGQGTGLGLALSQRIVQLMGGDIGVRSRPGAGSRFWFEVELGQATSLPVDHAPPAPGLDAPANLLEMAGPAEAAEQQALSHLRAWPRPLLQALEHAAAVGDFEACLAVLGRAELAADGASTAGHGAAQTSAQTSIAGGDSAAVAEPTAPAQVWLVHCVHHYRFDRLQALALQALEEPAPPA